MKKRRKRALADLLELDLVISHANNHGANLHDIERELDRIICILRPKKGIGAAFSDEQHGRALTKGQSLAHRLERRRI